MVLERSQLTDQVFNILNDRIVSGEYKVGEALPSQDKLATEIGVSRNTIREAINRLSTFGVLSPKQGVGTIVQSKTGEFTVIDAFERMNVSESDIFNIIEIRLATERTIVRLAALKAEKDHLDRLRRNLAEQKNAIAAHNRSQFAELDVNFHLLLAEASGNRLFVGIQTANLKLFRKFVIGAMTVPSLMEKAYTRHLEIFEAIIHRNAILSEQIMLEHLFGVIEQCLPGDERVKFLQETLMTQ
jgi:DNA-binding FadR family transcriptional regulator